ncbi:MAG: histidine kinase, gyrase and HSP90-like Atpase [Clostridiales bacterium]|jgi:signal transduction histidine kinase|nr:histidine kinase, gyrase and HSP90-like Atpase [Clostridiales bacterium]
MNQLQLSLMSGFDICMLVLVANRILKSEKKPKLIKIIIVIPIFAILLGISGVHTPNKIIGLLLNTILACFMLIILYRRPIIETSFIYFINLIIVTCVQLVIITIIKLVMGKIEMTFSYGIVAQSAGLVLIAIVSLYTPFELIYRFIRTKNKIVRFLIANGYALILFVAIYWNMDIHGMTKNLLSILMLSTMVAFINGVLLSKGWKDKFEEQELNIYKTYIPVVEQLIDDIRARQHEFDNHIQALKMIEEIRTEDDEISDLVKEYTSDIFEKNKWNSLIKFNNKIFSGFIYSKKKEAEQKGIEFDVILDTYFIDTVLKDYQLIEIAGVLINNAFEAIADLPEKHVILQVGKEKDMNSIEVKNRHPYLKDEIINNMFKKGFSTKSKEKRGYGLFNLQRLINSNEGKIEVFNENLDENYVVVKVLLN